MYHYPWTLQSVFPKDKNTVEHNHTRVINCWKFNIVILFYIINLWYHIIFQIDHISVLSVDPIISFVAFFSLSAGPSHHLCGQLIIAVRTLRLVARCLQSRKGVLGSFLHCCWYACTGISLVKGKTSQLGVD